MANIKPSIGDGHTTSIRLRPGDKETLEWLMRELSMSKADVIKHALTAYASQIVSMRKPRP